MRGNEISCKICWIILTGCFWGLAASYAEWDIQTLATGTGAGEWCSIDIDSLGYPHIAYIDSSTLDLKYIYRDNAGFHTMIAYHLQGSWGRNPALELDDDNHAHVSFYDDLPEGFIKYSFYNGSTWLTETIDGSADTGISSDLALDSSGVPHVSYYDYDHGILKYAHRTTGVWSVATISGSGTIGSANSIAIDQQDYPHICCYDETLSVLRHYYLDGTGWHTEQPYSQTVVGWHSSIAFDSNNRLHWSFYNHGEGALEYGIRTSGTWEFSTIVSDGDVGWFCALGVDSGNYPHIAYKDDTNAALKLSYRDAAGWHSDTPDSSVNLNYQIGLAVDENDITHLVYYDRDESALKYGKEMPGPTPTPTPPAKDVYFTLQMQDDYLETGDRFKLERTCGNNLTVSVTIDEYILLEVTGAFWFWPGWTQAADWETWTMSSGQTKSDDIFNFFWPEVSGSMTGLRFWGGLVQTGTSNLFDYAMVEFGYGEAPSEFQLASSAFSEGGTIPDKYTCDDQNVSPPLLWVDPPVLTQSYALIMDDPDAPGGTWVHWVIYHIPASHRNLQEDQPNTLELPDGSRQGLNSWGNIGYGGPCPPSGSHRYYFKLYALDDVLALPAGATKDELIQAMEGHIIEEATLMGRFR